MFQTKQRELLKKHSQEATEGSQGLNFKRNNHYSLQLSFLIKKNYIKIQDVCFNFPSKTLLAPGTLLEETIR